jgi:N-acetylglutamate synthase-like GNAT family acetyltransferase/SAM-dependent methyltransferase
MSKENPMSNDPVTVHETVRAHYASQAINAGGCCGPQAECCGDRLYPVDLLTGLPGDVANFSLGCGDPITLAGLKASETVLDLGSGGGLDCFLAAQRVGPEGRVIGVDMTPEMLSRARAAAVRLGAANVEFRQGYLEQMPVADNSVDVVISNCVINLSPDKPQVFREVFRTLKPGGRVAVSDIVINGAMPEALRNNAEAWSACLAGAIDMREYQGQMEAAGLVDVHVQPKDAGGTLLSALPVGVPFSAVVTARKPAGEAATIGAAQAAEAGAIKALLQANDLPADDLTSENWPRFFVARQSGRLVGVAGVALAGGYALLRSVAVRRESRRKGLAAQLVREAEAHARAHGVERMYLLTTTAQAFFARHGYRAVERGSAPPEMQATSEFTSVCGDGAVCMMKEL